MNKLLIIISALLLLLTLLFTLIPLAILNYWLPVESFFSFLSAR